MKAIFTIVIAIFAATFTFANNGNPAKGAPATTVVTVENNDATTEMSAAMDAVLGNLIANSTMATTATTMDNATILTVTSNEITVSNRFAVHTFNETTTSDDIAPVAAAMETIVLEAEEM
jgi:hypothetical protein